NISQGKSVTGDGVIVGNATNHGTLNPGYTPGQLEIAGDYTQAGDGVMNIEIGGDTAATQFDVLQIDSAAIIAGLLRITLINGYLPDDFAAFTFLTAGSLSGQFDNATGYAYTSDNRGRFD